MYMFTSKNRLSMHRNSEKAEKFVSFQTKSRKIQIFPSKKPENSDLSKQKAGKSTSFQVLSKFHSFSLGFFMDLRKNGSFILQQIVKKCNQS